MSMDSLIFEVLQLEKLARDMRIELHPNLYTYFYVNTYPFEITIILSVSLHLNMEQKSSIYTLVENIPSALNLYFLSFQNHGK